MNRGGHSSTSTAPLDLTTTTPPTTGAPLGTPHPSVPAHGQSVPAAPGPVTGSGTPTDGTGNGLPSGPPTTVPHPTTTTTVPASGPARFRIAYAVTHLTLQSGTTTPLTYAITNVGGATGYLYLNPCNPNSELWPTPRGLWPAPVDPIASCASTVQRIPLAPGASLTFTHTVAAGHYSGPNLVPAYPGLAVFWPPELPRPSASTAAPGGLAVRITPPASAPFAANRPTAVTAASGTEVVSPFALSNRLPFPVSFEFDGPRTRTRATTPGAGGCVGDPNVHNLTVFRCVYTLAGNATLGLDLDLWATDNLLPPSPPSVLPLAPGVYSIPWNEIPLQLTVT